MRHITTNSDFESLMSYSASPQVVVIDYYADWCGPCRQVAPLFEALSQKPEWDGVIFAKVNTDANQDLAKQEGISALPTFKVYFNRSCVNTIRGGRLDEVKSTLSQYYVAPIDPSVCDLVQEDDQQVFADGKKMLLLILDNIIREPLNEKYRSLKISNPKVESKLLPCSGAIQCLYSAGFQDCDDKFVLSPDANLDRVKRIRSQIDSSQWKQDPKLQSKPVAANSIKTSKSAAPSVKPLTAEELAAENSFLNRVISRLSDLHLYEDRHLQEKARSLMDLDARKKAASSSSDESFVRELLRWFKQDFFSWFDKPDCSNCKTACVAQSQAGVPNSDEIRWMAGRVELYRCARCNQEVRFARYNHPEKLLQTRQGRCGEWANCFTLILSSAGLRCRYVLDWTDHVWTEVFITCDGETEPRWIHCDPCEQAFDTPLLYEQGWGKKLSYIIGYAVETREIQDVSWRYSADYKQLMSRRTEIRENRFSNFLTKQFQRQLVSLPPQMKQQRLTERICELVSFLQESRPNGDPNEMKGRTTGSVEWRQQRGELGTRPAATVTKGIVIEPTSSELTRGEIYIRYNCALDIYERGPPGENPRGPGQTTQSSNNFEQKNLKDIETIKGWSSLTNEWKNITRKHEKDWKMVYLARNENCSSEEEGFISWSVDLSKSGFVIDEIKVFASSATFQSGQIRWQLCGDGDNALCMPVNGFLTSEEFSGATKVTLKVSVTGGDGKDAWQHGQICRQKDLDEATFPFAFVVRLKEFHLK